MASVICDDTTSVLVPVATIVLSDTSEVIVDSERRNSTLDFVHIFALNLRRSRHDLSTLTMAEEGVKTRPNESIVIVVSVDNPIVLVAKLVILWELNSHHRFWTIFVEFNSCWLNSVLKRAYVNSGAYHQN